MLIRIGKWFDSTSSLSTAYEPKLRERALQIVAESQPCRVQIPARTSRLGVPFYGGQYRYMPGWGRGTHMKYSLTEREITAIEEAINVRAGAAEVVVRVEKGEVVVLKVEKKKLI